MSGGPGVIVLLILTAADGPPDDPHTHVLPGTDRAHLPDPGQQPPSDHRLVTCSLTLDTPREERR